jgi:integrase/recombinase XerD
MSTELPTSLARALRGFFSDYLPRIRGVSPHTVLSYRDAFVLLLRFLASRHRRGVIALDLPDLTTSAVVAFLDHLETDRHNSAVTRNARLAAIHAFARYVAQNHPEYIQLCQQILALPFKRARQRTVEYLESEEISALLRQPSHSSPDGRRDRCLFLTLFNTGARVQEILDMRPCDLQLVRPFQVRLRGKGRKERVCPLWPQTAESLRALLDEKGVEPNATQPLFRNHRGEPLTRFGVRYLLRKHARAAQEVVPTLGRRRIHPHALRHSSAVHLLLAGVELVTISHWLGHASVETTNRYAAINLETKREALAKAKPIGDVSPVVAGWRNDASILTWLEAL